MDCHGRRLSSPGKVFVAFLTRVVKKLPHGGSVQKLESRIHDNESSDLAFDTYFYFNNNSLNISCCRFLNVVLQLGRVMTRIIKRGKILAATKTKFELYQTMNND